MKPLFLIYMHDEGGCEEHWTHRDPDDVEQTLLDSDVADHLAERVRFWCQETRPGTMTKVTCENGYPFFIIRLM